MCHTVEYFFEVSSLISSSELARGLIGLCVTGLTLSPVDARSVFRFSLILFAIRKRPREMIDGLCNRRLDRCAQDKSCEA